ncbi:hypothetical protein Hte_000435 [Hypoxylon texense]
MPEIAGPSPKTLARTISTWKLTATISNAYGSILYQFFDPSTQDGIVPLLDNIEIETLKVEYTYQGTKASSFVIDGTLMLGSLPLTLNFTHDSKEWSFDANLAFSQDKPQTTTIGDVAAHIFGPDLDLPDFVANITVTPPSEEAAGLKLSSADSTEPGKKDLLFTAWLNLGIFRFEAIQYRPAQKKDETTKPPAQRMFMLTIEGIKVANLDLIGELPQPFDQLLFLFVQRQEDNTAGLTKAEVDNINERLAAGNTKLQYKNTKKNLKDEDVVIPYGMHFMVLSKDLKGESSVVLDYVFGSGTKKQTLTSSSYSAKRPTAAMFVDEAASDPAGEKAPFEKTIGPVTIRNLGLKVTMGSPSSLSVLMDASVLLGPIGASLLGFKLTLKFGKGFDLQHLPAPEAAIDGLGVSFDRSPIILAGIFKHVLDAYQGAATVSFQPYLFQAAGFYGTITSKTGSKFTSSFVYFILNGPLVTLEFAEIRGVTGGFGYNTSLTYPTAANVTQFPLIDTPSESDPQSALLALTGGTWFFPRQNSFWLAAGVTVIAFEILEVKAVVVIEWDPKIKLGLFGVATASLPAGVTHPFARVQLGIVAAVDFNAGTLKIEGQLTPDSFILDPSCHLTGGFGLFYWFGNSKYAGDFTFTIGGYHRSYRPPSQFPNPPRLGISWSYDSAISIRGEAYFAITPKVCMGGGRLDASLSLGPLYAFFDAYADFLINYKPFHFTADGGLSVGVRFTLDLWICTIHISIELSARLYLEGPPIAGTVHVNFWVFGFDIDFGHKEPRPNIALNIDQFIEQVLQADNSNVAETIADAKSEAPPAHIFSCNQGLIPSSEKDAESDPNTSVWKVRGAVFQFTIGCKFAFKTASVETTDATDHKTYIIEEPEETKKNDIYAKPMCLQSPLSSDVAVSISSMPTGMLITSMEVDVPLWNKAEMLPKSVPAALWGKYNPANDPNNPSNTKPNQNGDLLKTTDGSVALPMSIQITSPVPVLSTDDKLPSFDYKTFFIKDAGDERHFPTTKDAKPTWLPDQDGENLWERVRSQWNGQPKLGEGATEQAVKLWADLSFTQWHVGESGDVSWEKPSELLEAETFDTLFLEAPRMGAATA